MVDSLKAALGAQVRALRRSRGLTQERLAEELGVTPRYLAGIERGERNLTLDSVDALAGAARRAFVGPVGSCVNTTLVSAAAVGSLDLRLGGSVIQPVGWLERIRMAIVRKGWSSGNLSDTVRCGFVPGMHIPWIPMSVVASTVRASQHRRGFT